MCVFNRNMYNYLDSVIQDVYKLFIKHDKVKRTHHNDSTVFHETCLFNNLPSKTVSF